MPAPQTPEQKEAAARIETIDAALDVHREAWMQVAPANKPKWWAKINELLDQRISEMAVRDGIVGVLV